jgi:hypothetical protein
MISLWFILSLTHLIGLGLGVGAATVKLVLLIRCNSNYEFVQVFLKVSRTITRIIVTGLILLTLSGIGWILMGTYFTTIFIIKLFLVGAVWVVGPVIDNVIEPKFKKLAPAPAEQATPEFIRIQKQYLLLELLATTLFYVIIILGVLL